MLKEIIGFSILGLPKGLISILIISALITFLQLLVYKKLSDQNRIKELKEKQKALYNEMKNVKDEKKLKKINQEIMSINTELMKLSLWPTLLTFFPLVIIFISLRYAYAYAEIGNIIEWPWNLPIVGNGAGWFLCYIIFGLIFSIIFRKFMKIY
jgi:uncharacterized membrane protein (DUF106 family)